MSQALSLPIFLDSLFTTMTAALFGLRPGVTVGLFTNLFIEVVSGFPGYLYPFGSVNILSAVITWLIVSKGRFNTITEVFWTMIILALANALVGAFVVTLVFGGITNEGVDDVVRAFLVTGNSLFSSAFLARILVNIVDKGLAVAVTYPIYRLVRKKYAVK